MWYNKNMNKKSGFTVIELCAVIIFLIIIGVFFVIQKSELNALTRDLQRKNAINAMYYNLEEVFYKQNNYYPEKISQDNLKAMEPNLFTDPEGINLGEENSDYRYESSNCENGKCKSYKLISNMEKEGEFTKKSRNN